MHSSFPPQPKPVYNSQLCADKLEALSQEQGREEAVVLSDRCGVKMGDG